MISYKSDSVSRATLCTRMMHVQQCVNIHCAQIMM